MRTTNPTRLSTTADPSGDGRPDPTLVAMLGETVPLICAFALYGPPVVFLVGPWLLLGLMLSGPFALVLALVVALAAAAALVGSIATIVATPYLLVRGLRTGRISIGTPAAVRVPTPRVAA